MISPDLLDILCCPLAPGPTRLEEAGDHLVCPRCGLKFAVREGIPNMVAEEAELPEGCASLADLPCKRQAAAAPPVG